MTCPVCMFSAAEHTDLHPPHAMVAAAARNAAIDAAGREFAAARAALEKRHGRGVSFVDAISQHERKYDEAHAAAWAAYREATC